MSRIKEFNLPDLGEGLTEGEILAWLVKVGDTIELNQPIVEVETAKAAVEIPAKWGGVVTRIFHEAGTVVEVGKPIIAIDTQPGSSEEPPAPASSPAPASAPAPSPAPASASSPAADEAEAGLIGGPAPGGRTAVLVGYGPRTTSATRRPRIGTPVASTTATTPTPPPAAAEVRPAAPVGPAQETVAPVVRTGPVLAKPPVRKLARDLGVDLTTVNGTGPLGSVTRDDVHLAVSSPAREPAPTAASPATAVFDASREQRIPIKGVRKLTAENMVASAFTAPHVTEFLTVDVTRSMKALEKLRKRPEFEGARISPLLLVAKAVLLAVKRHPMVNSSWSGATGEIVVKDYVNLGIAAATERGLIVPNVKDAGRLTLRELAEALNELVRTAKSGKTPPADMSGGTLSITNVGVFGIDTGTPILPPGESAILAFGAIRPTPWVHKGKIRIREVTTLGLSFDHRIIDGELGSRFLRDIGAFLEDPEATLLSWT
ncbi:pyruvate dehydrogenase E2 component (dihydrolipoamide acetyltransferase) [Actinoplanes campanulatus]|uniref:Dihydrolipoamide acetyltransferase component of pyruvate dehydrogenase complex n=1 Tax=Actinoplanes campanulatus TaxID=113559 RepID=A0A7W5FIG3_9ACTN|nr:dihydrolipoamide acetyltransferase family protein [Actinoplanes campanulatus]MBB3099683.1 pyruvate dehydrogenase E2 component (dihydrolipoamide acetyltransferase) [Actinoplanes campanulatus]GGN25764.1 dihydrolipoamide acetyltransferase component of pyruvate dehydrogenase complex [Actinoplanes campanulatus]GID41576.1 dihydrolipoamide acetyltransferase component of pyruvate dehydrogenase complex [Actinoplanes campanulatus]